MDRASRVAVTSSRLGWTPRFAAAFEPFRGGGDRAGARQPRAHPHLSRDRRRRASASRASPAACVTTPKAAPISRGRRLGRARRRRPGGDARIRAVLPRSQPVLAARRRQSDRGAGRRRQHRRRLPRLGARPRLQSAAHRALPVTAWESGAVAGDRAQQGGPGRRPGRVDARGRERWRRACRCMRSRRGGRRCSTRCAPPRAGAHRGAARIVGRRQVVDRQRPDRRGACARAKCASRTAAAGTRRPAVSSCCCPPAASSSTRPACASCSCGTRGAGGRRVCRHRGARRRLPLPRLPPCERARLRRRRRGRRRRARRGAPRELPQAAGGAGLQATQQDSARSSNASASGR